MKRSAAPTVPGPTEAFTRTTGNGGLLRLRRDAEANGAHRLLARPNLLEAIEAPGALVPMSQVGASARVQFGQELSPSQVRTFLNCSARWWFKYAVGLPEPKTSSLALGIAVHRALELNFREKLATGGDLEPLGVVALFRDAWLEHRGEVEFRDDEDPVEIRRLGERLVAKYMDEAAPRIQPAAVELEVSGVISGVRVSGRVDLVDKQRRIVDVKTASRRPAEIAPDYAFQLSTYNQITPGVVAEARLDTLVKTRAVQLVQLSFTVGEQDLVETRRLYPLVQEGIRSGLYFPNRQSILCSRRQCPFWRHCEREFGGRVKAS